MILGALARLLLPPVLAVAFVYDVVAAALGRIARNDKTVKERRSLQRGVLNAEAGLSALSAIQDVASSVGVKMFLVSGTLLGLFREGRLLAHDYDVDVGIMSDDPKLSAFLEAMSALPGLIGQKTIYLSELDCLLNPWLGLTPTKPVLQKFFFANEAGKSSQFGVDVFIHYAANDYLVHGNYRCLWINRPFELMSKNYGGSLYLVPVDTRRYLTENYGDFEIENKDFENSADCPNSTNLYGVRAVSWLCGRYAYFLTTGSARKRKIIGRRLRDCLAYGLLLANRPVWSIRQYESFDD